MVTSTNLIECPNCETFECSTSKEIKGDFEHIEHNCDECGFYTTTLYGFSKKSKYKQQHEKLDMLMLGNIEDIKKGGA